jgi:hypothetical protein
MRCVSVRRLYQKRPSGSLHAQGCPGVPSRNAGISACKLLMIAFLLGNWPAHAYSQSSQQALIDLVWYDSIRPLLLERYPHTTASGLIRAQGYAYGGCLIQDIGYYPFGKPFFSSLAHYVRSGDFVAAMLRNARDVDELAFAIGALSHYVGDSIGHSEATNPATALTFPDLEVKYGPVVSYEDAPTGHVRTEFGFDVAQMARKRYASRRYRKAIGFRVARRLLYQTFQETYGLPPRGILGPARSALPSYRWSIDALVPEFVRAQIVLLRKSLPAEQPDAAQRQFLLNISGAPYTRSPLNTYVKPGIRAHLLAFLIVIIPKLGRLKILDVESPSEQTEKLFLQSMDDAVDAMRDFLLRLRGQADLTLNLENIDLDTGKQIQPGVSRLVDGAHAELTIRMSRRKAPPAEGIRHYLLGYFADPGDPTHSAVPQKQRRDLLAALAALQSAQ